MISHNLPVVGSHNLQRGTKRELDLKGKIKSLVQIHYHDIS